VLQPWLRLVLLQALARRDRTGAAAWDTVHRLLRDWHRGQPDSQQHRLDAQYHSLALGELDEVVGHLARQLRLTSGIDSWLYELYAVTAAPMPEPVPPSGPGEGRHPAYPRDRVRELAHRLAPAALEEHGALTTLVTALWLAADPRNRTEARPELNSTIASNFGLLVEKFHHFFSGLAMEVERYR
jgi:hypothetical protein